MGIRWVNDWINVKASVEVLPRGGQKEKFDLKWLANPPASLLKKHFGNFFSQSKLGAKFALFSGWCLYHIPINSQQGIEQKNLHLRNLLLISQSSRLPRYFSADRKWAQEVIDVLIHKDHADKVTEYL